MNPDFLKVREHPDLIRDTRSKAILNTNDSELAKYREERDFKMKVQQTVKDVESLKADVADIKGMLQELIRKL